MATKTKAPGYHHGDLCKALLQAAEQVLVEQGAAGLSLRAVARQAGVSHAAPYRHFSDKAALLRALAQTGFERLAVAIHAAVATVPHNPGEQLVEAGVAYVRLAVDQPEITQLMFGGTIDPHDDAACQRAASAANEGLVEIIREGVRIGVFCDRDARELALVAWTAMHGLAMLITARLLDPAACLDERMRLLTRTFIYGIAK